MSTVLGERGVPDAKARWLPWLAVASGLAALFVPTYVSLAQGAWREDAYAHGPIILAIFAWLAWRERAALSMPARPLPLVGFPLLAAGLVSYVAGRAFGLPLFEVAAELPILAGLVLALFGARALRRFAFALVFLAFLVPLPGFVLEWATTPLKEFVSVAVATLLTLAGYPIERSGVVLELGGHPMLVADACSGLNSIFSLLALALLYSHVSPPRSAKRTALLLASAIPIAVAANVVRVAALVLIAHHLGEDAAQGFLHGFAGLLVFVVALALLVAFDSLVRRFVRRPAPRDELEEAAAQPAFLFTRSQRPSLALPLVAAVLMVGSAIAAPAMRPAAGTHLAIDLERAFPASFEGWRIDPDTPSIAPAPDVQANLARIYDQVLSRTYVNAAGERMMLTVAHGGDQSDALKAHRQEKCYQAQGFDIAGLAHGTLALEDRVIPVTRMVAVRGERVEPVTYWFTMGDRVVLGRLERLVVQLRSGLAGRVPDGMLVRVSSISADPANAFAAQEAFAGQVLRHVAPADVARFAGAPGA